ncbi:hypothetical protein EJ07DRAFT_157616 [Lizonia empirigonia]|nr:hypothetical protein EJ07DRAFT_157616 [Lizonia empirigonia]
MKSIINFVVCALAMCLAVPVGAIPPPLTEGIQSFNVTIPLNGTSNGTISALGYDPSNDWHGYATVEVWTGGGLRKPVNVGHLNGLDLHRRIYDTFNRACPPTSTPWGGYCDGDKWLDFHTKYLFAPPTDVRECTGWIKPGNAQWATDQLRIIMMNIAKESSATSHSLSETSGTLRSGAAPINSPDTAISSPVAPAQPLTPSSTSMRASWKLNSRRGSSTSSEIQESSSMDGRPARMSRRTLYDELDDKTGDTASTKSSDKEHKERGSPCDMRTSLS